jgi:uncharacterized membrane protein
MTQLFGHLHPLLVHLPIGLIVLLAILELLAAYPRFKSANASGRFILALAIPLAIFTALCGWLLSIGGSYGDRLLQLHKWTGIGTAAACAIAGLFYWLGYKRLYRFSLFSTIIVLVIASHFGGSLTHGSDYLVRFAPEPLRSLFGAAKIPQQPKVIQIADLRAFDDVVQPMLRDNCIACHGPEKSESALRLDSLAGLLKGGKSGPVLVAGKAAESSLVDRLRMPLEKKEHMPPEGKPQPATDQITLLQWWIDAGAPSEKKISQLNPPAKILRALQARFGNGESIVRKVPPRPLNEIQPLVAKLADELDIVLSTLSPNEPWLQCNASVAGTNFGDAALARLAPLSKNLRWLDLAGTKVSDAGLTQIAGMPNLTRLHLERTAITDAGLARISTLPQLQYLNLYGTEVSDNGLKELQLLPKLKQLYLWQTKVTPAAAKAFSESLTDNDQLQLWQNEIAQLNAKIKHERTIVEVGTPVTPMTNSAPINAQCPVSGKPVDPGKTVLHDGKVIAFCCDDCKEKFQRDPKALLSKLNVPAAATETKAGKK